MNNSPILVSVVIACFNHGKFIKQAIEGVLNQQVNFNYEILINDDASTDASALILKEYEEKYPNLFKITYQIDNQYSKGVKPWFHILFPQAKGKYIALCDGDDYWTDPYKLQKQVDFLEVNSDYVIHSGIAQIFQEDDLKNEFIGLEDNVKEFSIENFYKQNNLVTCTVMFRNILQEFPGVNSKIAFGDWSLYVLLLKKSGLKAFRSLDLFSVYRVHSVGVVSGLSLQKEYELHLKQIVELKKIIGYQVFPKDVLHAVNWYSYEKFKLEINEGKFMSSLKTFINNFYLVLFKMSFIPYLSTLKKCLSK